MIITGGRRAQEKDAWLDWMPVAVSPLNEEEEEEEEEEDKSDRYFTGAATLNTEREAAPLLLRRDGK